MVFRGVKVLIHIIKENKEICFILLFKTKVVDNGNLKSSMILKRWSLGKEKIFHVFH